MLNEPQIKKRSERINKRLKLMTLPGSSGVKHIMSAAETGSGKRVRGLMALLSNESCGGQNSGIALKIACAIEALHQATLFHDDVIDDADRRRGLTALHRKAGAEISVLAGDYLLSLATAEIVNIGNIDMLKAGVKAVKLTCEGEIEEIYERFNPNLSENKYLDIITKKTACIISASCELGALSAGCDSKTAGKFAKFGLYTGIAFQIKDDVLDVTGNSNCLGKPTGSDIREGKVTLPLIVALKNSPKKSASSIKAMIKSRECIKMADEITAFIRKFGGAESAAKSAEKWLDRALAEIDGLKGLKKEPLNLLKRLAVFSVHRNN